ncbi:MAG TPA: site-2 protease family protein [Candidatus Binataceae bacterium]|nr:site-2 protease family protein [Candidatus Binataceae bacterium]
MLSDNLTNFILELSIWAVPTIFSIVAHEVMHGEVALRLGDDTAERAGRLTLNPISHVDPLGTVILPGILLYLHLPVFGWAKPVPVDFRRLRNGRTGMVMVAAAGPLTNLTLAIASAFLARELPQLLDPQAWRTVVIPLVYMLRASVIINVALAIFNLLPLLPLDGGRVLAGLLPLPLAIKFARLERYGFLILILLLYSNFFERLIDPIINTVTRILL